MSVRCDGGPPTAAEINYAGNIYVCLDLLLSLVVVFCLWLRDVSVRKFMAAKISVVGLIS